MAKRGSKPVVPSWIRVPVIIAFVLAGVAISPTLLDATGVAGGHGGSGEETDNGDHDSEDEGERDGEGETCGHGSGDGTDRDDGDHRTGEGNEDRPTDDAHQGGDRGHGAGEGSDADASGRGSRHGDSPDAGDGGGHDPCDGTARQDQEHQEIEP